MTAGWALLFSSKNINQLYADFTLKTFRSQTLKKFLRAKLNRIRSTLVKLFELSNTVACC